MTHLKFTDEQIGVLLGLVAHRMVVVSEHAQDSEGALLEKLAKEAGRLADVFEVLAGPEASDTERALLELYRLTIDQLGKPL